MNEVSQQVDLSSCAAEPIHIIGRIQSFGYLVAFSSDWILNHASVNCERLFGRKLDDLIGSPAAQYFDGEALHEIRSRLQMLGGPDAVDRIFGIDPFGNGQLFDVAIHASGRSFVLELEPVLPQRRSDYVGYVRPMVDRMRNLGSVEDLCNLAARQLRGLTGFDRVMVYRFAQEGAGEVIAESRSARVDSFQGLHFPASDIPAQARRLYTRNILRIISDIDDPTVPIMPATNPDGEPLDLSMSGLRAVSPIHIEYLRNMGVRASMSVSILRNGELWGLMACHHYAPLQLNYAVRTSCELFGQFMSFLLEQTELRLINARKSVALKLHDEIMAHVPPGARMIEAFDGFAESIAKVIQYDSIAGWIDGELVAHGAAPDRVEFARLARFLNTTGASRIWQTDNLAQAFPEAAAYADTCAGLLALPVSRSPRDYIVLFRKSQVQTVNWAGDPNKPVEHGPLGARLTPRKSFELWREERQGFAIPWSEDDVATADSLRITLLEVVLRLNDAAQRERDKASKKQETLIAELNHRVRNILNLIRGLVAQSQHPDQSRDEFATVIGHRVYALARAHDQVTKVNWAPASFQALLQAEAEAYIGDRLERLALSGLDAWIEPAAVSTLALVFHELMTNSRKHGALSDKRGKVTVAITRNDQNGIDVVWTERGGPTVKPPRRRGFGSTIIENSIPHELRGRTVLRFDPEGLVAEFSVPAEHVFSFGSLGETSIADRATAPAIATAKPLSGEVLIVEDNLIIAMEAEDLLQELGAERCHVASHVTAALDLVERVAPRFALLDVNLGRETSEPVAAALLAKGIPFVVASGYGEDIKGNPALGQAQAITKPYAQSELAAAVAATLG